MPEEGVDPIRQLAFGTAGVEKCRASPLVRLQRLADVKLQGAILFAPAGELVPVALAALDRGGTLAVAGIHLSDIPSLDYQAHLFQERTLCSVTANTRADGEALLHLAATIPLHASTEEFPLEQANEALYRLRHDEIRGAAVLRVRL